MSVATGIVLLLFVVLGAFLVAAAFWRRRAVALRAGTFRCKIRPAGPKDGSPAWSGGAVRARWASNVLIAQAGLFHEARQNLVVRGAHTIVERTTTGRRRSRVSIRLDLRDGSSVEVVTARRYLDVLGGPFVTSHPAFRPPHADQNR